MSAPIHAPPSMRADTEGLICPACGARPAEDPLWCPIHERFTIQPEARARLSQAPLLGQALVGRYILVDRVGGGGMGVVYRAVDARLDRPVAVKVLHAFVAASDDERGRFEREARALSRLTGDHTVTVFDYGVVGEGALTGLAFIVMELIEGQPLDLRLEEGPLRPSEASEVVDQVALALDEAHRHGIVHRDLKPSNLILTTTPDGRFRVKVIDFGIARVGGGSGTRSGVMMGTPHYMAPEQCGGGTGQIDARTDVYALAVVAFEMLAGQPPFDAPDAMQIVLKQFSQPPPPLPRLSEGGAWTALNTVVHSGLAKAPEDRPEGAMVFARTLQEAAGSAPADLAMPAVVTRPVAARASTGAGHNTATPMSGELTTRPPEHPAGPAISLAPVSFELKGSRRRSVPSWVVAIALGVVVAGVATVVMMEDDARPVDGVQPARVVVGAGPVAASAPAAETPPEADAAIQKVGSAKGPAEADAGVAETTAGSPEPGGPAGEPSGTSPGATGEAARPQRPNRVDRRRSARRRSARRRGRRNPAGEAQPAAVVAPAATPEKSEQVKPPEPLIQALPLD